MVFLFVAAIVASGALAWAAYRDGARRLAKTIAAIGVMAAAFVLYAYWMNQKRGVDPMFEYPFDGTRSIQIQNEPTPP
jgi:hypothetical protein